MIKIILPLLLIILVFIIIIFFTIFERKLLASIQRRRGPHYNGLWGIFQGIADGLKLISSEVLIPKGANKWLFVLTPMLLLTSSLSIWSVIPISPTFTVTNYNCSILLYFCLTSTNSILILLAGLSSNSRYATLGSVRVAAQFISYEMPFMLSIVGLILTKNSFQMYNVFYSYSSALFFSIPFFIIACISLLAETNRIPFDLAEAESELVAGYNVEYSSILFSFFFLAEYSNILTASFFISFLFWGGVSSTLNILCALLIAAAIVVVRAILPRYRYTDLLSISWNVLLILVFAYFLFIVCISIIFNLSNISLEMLVNFDFVQPLPCIITNTNQVFSINNNVVSSLVYFIISFFFSILLLIITYKLAPKKWNNQKLSSYECGYEPVGRYKYSNTTVNFSLIAIIFLIFDVELVFLYLFVMNTSIIGVVGVISVILFLVVLILGYIVEVCEESFNFTSTKKAFFGAGK